MDRGISSLKIAIFALGLMLLCTAAPSRAQEASSSASGPKSEYAYYNSSVAWTFGPVLAGTSLAALGAGTDSELQVKTGVGMILGGLVLGPSAGQYSLGSYGHGLLATGIRGLGGVLIVMGTLSNVFGGMGGEETPGTGMALLGTATYLGGVAYSILETHSAYRRQSPMTQSPALGLVPVLTWNRAGDFQGGAQAWLRF